ncbi:insulinase family protein [Leptobacterium flavescens]|uniref:Insulinase family protein n=1 Tax=Leptobacterium flavescens TaxID=472055 RepID=A0A6P0UMY4_9FLAO|nr:insulinase family protein [Leptobacterium flavescens]NER14535.1 insulinase family protein [Leptobacterium flavescens]
MKKIIFSLLLISAFTLNAQVDRSKQPKPGPAPEINLGTPKTFELGNGLKVLVVENHKLPRVSYSLTIDNPPIAEGDKAGVAALTGSMIGKGSKNIEKDAFNEEVDYLGAFINFGSGGAFAGSLSKYGDRVLELMADAAINPNFTQEEFDKEKAILLDNLKSGEKSVPAVAGRVRNVLAYGKNHPKGEFTTKETVNNVNLQDVKDFYRNYFVPANAYLVVIGDVDFDHVQEQVKKNFSSWTKAVPPSYSYSKPSNAQYTQINFVDMPNAVQSEVAVQNIINLEMKDEDYFPALIANKILGGGAEARLFLNLREDKGYTYGAYSGIGTDKNAPSTFRATASVRNMVTDSAVVAFLDEINRIGVEPVSDEDLRNAKAKYVGDFVLALERPQTIASYALNIETEGLPKDFYKNYLSNINAVTKEDVQRAAKKYFQINNARIVVVGKGKEVLENLEKVKFNGKKIPVMYYDKYGAKAEKPNYEAALPADVSAKSVIQKYITAVGGESKLKAVNSVFITAEASTQGLVLNLELKTTSSNKFAMDMKMAGNSLVKQVYDGEKGYVVQQGQRQDLSGEQLGDLKEQSVPFPELNYLNDANVTLEGVEDVEGKKAYAIKVTDKRTSYYDVETGLKVKDVTKIEQAGQSFEQAVLYGDYKEVGGIQFPFILSQSFGPQKVEFKVKNIKVNEGVSDEDFN